MSLSIEERPCQLNGCFGLLLSRSTVVANVSDRFGERETGR